MEENQKINGPHDNSRGKKKRKREKDLMEMIERGADGNVRESSRGFALCHFATGLTGLGLGSYLPNNFERSFHKKPFSTVFGVAESKLRLVPTSPIMRWSLFKSRSQP